MSEKTSNAIWLEADGRLTVHRITVDDRYTPQGSQTLVEVAYSAINPADKRHFFMGLSDYVAGYEWVGKAIETGPASPFKVGQQLFGMTLAGHNRPISSGVHQDYLLADTEWSHVLPAGLKPTDAVAFPVGNRTAIDGLFNQMGFALPAAGISGTSAEGEAILIWGGSGMVGQAALQLAKAAGFAPIIATGSPRNHDLLQQLGATHCVDYRSPNVVEQIRSVLNGKKLRVALDAVSTGLGCFEGLTPEEEKAVQEQYHLSSSGLARKSLDEGEELKLAAVLPSAKDPDWKFVMPYRVPDGVEPPKPKGIEQMFVGVPREWGNRMQKILDWLLEDAASRWIPPKSRIEHGADAGIVAIQDVFEGKAGGEKVLIEHPI